MPRYRPLLSENEERAEANRQTSGLFGVVVILLLLVVGLFLIHTLHDAAKVEDCLMAGRMNCDRMVITAH